MKKIILTFLFCLCITSCSYANSLRERAVDTYIHGVLSGSGEESFPIWKGGGYRDLPWLISVAYPVTSWSWNRAIVDDVLKNGGDTLVKYRRPDVSDFISGDKEMTPRSVREWFAMERGSYRSQSLSKGEMVLKIGDNGLFPDEAASLLREAVLRDIYLAVDWCIKHEKRPYSLMQLISQVRYSSVPVVPPDLKKTLDAIK